MATNEAELRARLVQLSARHSQAEIARKTGLSRANVSRYWRKNRIPAALCSALIAQFGVNPAWLMAGEGTPYLADVSASHAKLGANLLELVEAMNAVAKMRLGSLAGKRHLEILRELSDALSSYERLKDKLNRQSRDILRQVLTDWRRALAEVRPERAHPLRRAAEQVARLCDDAPLNLELLALQAIHETSFGDPDKAVAFQRQVFMRAAPASAVFDHAALEQGTRLVIMLRHVGRSKEALAVCRALVGLAHDAPLAPRERVALDGQYGWLLVETCELEEGLPWLRASCVHSNALQRTVYGSRWAQAQFLAGTFDFDQLARFGTRSQWRAEELIKAALWLEQPQALKAALTEYAEARKGVTHDPIPEAQVAQALLDAQRGMTLARVRGLLEPVMRGAARFAHHRFQAQVHDAQAAWLSGQKAAAKASFEAASKMLDALPQELDRPHLAMLIYHRLALRLCEPGKEKRHEAARAWFEQLKKRGYAGCGV